MKCAILKKTWIQEGGLVWHGVSYTGLVGAVFSRCRV
jgi:hypothetical protein